MKVKKIGIVSLSSGILGEEMVAHEVQLGLERLEAYGIQVVFMDHAKKGLDYLKKHPEDRAKDLLAAFEDDSIDMILSAIGGDDTYRLLPYLFDQGKLEKVAKQKIFLGFSDTTINHLMLHKLGLQTFYGQAFLTDICELAEEMLPYSRQYFEELIETGTIKEVRPSQLWYQEREDYSPKGLGVAMPAFANEGFELLRGKPSFQGEILGGCLESIFTLFDKSRYEDTVIMGQKYQLFPSLDQWQDKILLLETSEGKPSPALFRKMIRRLEDHGLFHSLAGLLFGKPQDEAYYEDYKKILLEEISRPDLPILYNINVGHASPRCIIPFGIPARVDAEEEVIRFY